MAGTRQGDGTAQPEREVRYRWAAQLCRNGRALDAACGAGWGTAVLAAGGASAVGVDISPAAIEAALKRYGDSAEFHEADIRELPFAAAEFDCVVCFEALTHLPDPDRALDELCRVLRPGGTLLVSAPNPDAYPPGNPLQLSELTPQQLAEALRSRLANVAVHAQQVHFASMLGGEAPAAAGCGEAPAAAGLHAVAAASDGELPPRPAELAVGAKVGYVEQARKLREWKERAVAAEAEAFALRRELRATTGEQTGGRADFADAYLELLKRSLVDLLGPTTSRAIGQHDGSLKIEEVPEEERGQRVAGSDWPANGMSMIGLERLTNVQRCVERVIAEGVPGDLIETGVWRGGTAILMRALLDVHGDAEREVWLADSFAGLPPPDLERYPQDEVFAPLLDPGFAGGENAGFLVVPVADVRRNFERYGLLDERVRFVEGWFRDTLPTLAGHPWAVIRLDGDLYESTIQALESLYPDLSPGGYVIVDDYGVIPACRKAVEDYRAAHGIDAEIERIDPAGVFWRKP